MPTDTRHTSKPNRLGELSIGFADVVLRTVEIMGFERHVLEQRFQLGDPLFSSSNARISIPKFMRLGHAAIQHTGDPALGLQIGSNTRVADYGVSGFASLCAPDLKTATEILIDYDETLGYNSRGNSSYFVEDRRHVLQFYSISPYNEYNFFVVDLSLSSWFQLCVWLTGQEDLLERVDIEYPEPENAAVYTNYFGCSVRFDAPRNALIFKRGKERLENRFASRTHLNAALMKCDAEKAALTENRQFKDQVAQLISQKLASGEAKLGTISEALKLSPWTLRRRLENEGFSFQTLLEQTRQSLAIDYVRDTAFNFTEIAYLLGFANPEGFQRAFKRWTGQSPGMYRKIARGDRQ